MLAGTGVLGGLVGSGGVLENNVRHCAGVELRRTIRCSGGRWWLLL